MWIKVPKYINQYDDIENQTKIMMRFMADLTDIYFLTWNSLRLSIENGWSKSRFFSCQDGSCDDDSGLIWNMTTVQKVRTFQGKTFFYFIIQFKKIFHLGTWKTFKV